MTPEEQARQEIDRRLEQCGWLVQHDRDMNISAGLGVAIREFPLTTLALGPVALPLAGNAYLSEEDRQHNAWFYDLDYWRKAPVWTPATIAQATNTWFDCLSSRQ